VLPSSAEVTLPDTIRSCAIAEPSTKTNKKHIRTIFFIGFDLVYPKSDFHFYQRCGKWSLNESPEKGVTIFKQWFSKKNNPQPVTHF
jgi:hypothetical protein